MDCAFSCFLSVCRFVPDLGLGRSPSFLPSLLSWLRSVPSCFLPSCFGRPYSFLILFLVVSGRARRKITFGGGGDEREFLSFFVASFFLVGSQFLRNRPTWLTLAGWLLGLGTKMWLERGRVILPIWANFSVVTLCLLLEFVAILYFTEDDHNM